MTRSFTLAAILLAASTCAHASFTTLYDGTTNAVPTTPWTVLTIGYSPSAQTGYTRFDSTGSNFYKGGMSRSDVLLDSDAGLTLRFLLRLNSEQHSSTDRAGLSVIAIDQNLNGIEIGFWIDQVWAQNVGFTKGESAALNTAQLITYDLVMQSGNYTLFGNNTQLLNGVLRNYSSFGTPYNIPNFLFIGDDTGSAKASYDVAGVSYQQIPEPTTLATAAAALTAASLSRKRRVRQAR